MAWNRPTSNTVDATSSSSPTGRGKMPRLRTSHLIAGAAVVVLGLAALWIFSGGDTAPKAKVEKTPARIKEVKSVKLPAYCEVLTNDTDMIVLPNGVVTNKPKTIAEAIAMVRLKPGFHSYKSVDEVFSKANYFQIGEYKTLNLKTSTEAQLSLIATRRRDQIMPPMPPMPAAMAGDFQKALNNYLQAAEGDSETDIKTKKKIEMMKEMMLSYVNDKGMTPAQALHEVEKDHNRSANLYQLYRGEYIRMCRTGNPDADAFYDRAIDELGKKGAPKFDRDAKYIDED